MITVLGSVNLDLVARVDRLPRPGETIAGKAFAMLPGGKGANQALAARRAGAEVKLIATVGDDAFAGPALAQLRADEPGPAGDDAAHPVLLVPGSYRIGPAAAAV